MINLQDPKLKKMLGCFLFSVEELGTVFAFEELKEEDV
jgi:hypothetical protein